jgi:hypothetical protein
MKRDVPSVEDNSLRKAQALFDELASHCGSGADREIRAPTKLLLLLALEKFRRHGGPGWMSLLEEHIDMIKEDPEKYDRMIKCQRGEGGLSFHSESWRRAAPASA